MTIHAHARVSALLWLLAAAGALAADPVVLSPTGQREARATLAQGQSLALEVPLPANTTALLRAASDRIDVTVEVRDGSLVYETDSPAFVAGAEYVLLEPAVEARTVSLVVRADADDAGDGAVQVQLIDADAANADIARRWAALGRAKRPPADEADALNAWISQLEALRTACATSGDARCVPETQLALGSAYEAAGRIDAVQPAYSAAIEGFAADGAVLGEITARYGYATRLYNTGKLDEAEAIYAQCAALARTNRLAYREAMFENFVAVMRQYAGDLDAALAHYDRATAALGDRRSSLVAMMRSNVGGVHELRGDFDRALASYQEAIDIAGDDPALRYPRAMAVSNLGALRADLGQKQEAIVLLSESLSEFRALDKLGDQSRVLSILGYQFHILRRPQLAEPLLRHALDVCRTRANSSCEASASRALAQFLYMAGRMDEAATAYTEAQRLAAVGTVYSRAQLATDLSDFHLVRGDVDAASAVIEAAAADPGIVQMKRYDAPIALIRGRILAARGEDAAARAAFEAVETVAATLQVDPDLARARIGIARLDAKAGRWAEVERRAAAEIAAIGKVRQEFYDPLLRADFLAARQEAYELLIQAKFARSAAGDATALREAFDIDERSRSRGLLDALAETDAATRDGDAELLAAREVLRGKQLALRRLSTGGEPPDAARVDALESEIANARVALEALEVRAGTEQRAALGKPRTIDEVQAGLVSERQAVLMYRLRDGGSWVWVVTRDTLRRVELPAPAMIADRVDRFAADLRAGNETETDGRWLYDTLVAPAALPAAVREVLIVPDGALQRLPFVALHAPDGRYLIESLQLSMLPSTSVGIALAEQRRQPRTFPAQDVVVFADPIFARDDPRLGLHTPGVIVANAPAGALDDMLGAQLMRSGGIDDLQRLPGTAREAQAMREAFGERVVVFEGLDATLAAARSDTASNARILHFATHGLVDAQAPELTGLALSRWKPEGAPADGDGFFSLPLIGETRFNAELVILSACDSAVGRDVESEGLIGVSRGFLAAGAGSVIATLWPVSDREAARLDARLAAEMQAGASAAQALQAAQREAIADPQRRRQRSWAAFGFYGPL